ERYARAIGNIYALLKPGGIFIWSDNFVHERAIRGTHQVSRSLESIEKLLAATGFQIIDRSPLFYLMNAPVDSRGRIRKLLWLVVYGCAYLSDLLGLLLGAFFYPLERMLTTFGKESPTTEVMICRR